MVLASDAGGAADLRVKAFIGVLRKHIPGNPSIVMQYMPGGGGRKAANHVFGSARPDGLTIGAMLGGLVYSAIIGETGVLYDLDRFIYLGSPDSATQYVFFTRADGDLNTVEKLRTAHGVRIGSQNAGSWSLYHRPDFRVSDRYERAEIRDGLQRPRTGCRASPWRSRRQSQHCGYRCSAEPGVDREKRDDFSRAP